LEQARLSTCEIDHVNAHGSGTPQNDVCETNAVKRVFGAHARALPVNSLKAMVGHALGASNALEVAACALEMRHQFIFPTINLVHADPDCDLDYVPRVGRASRLRNVLKLSNGFSGIHSALVLSRISR